MCLQKLHQVLKVSSSEPCNGEVLIPILKQKQKYRNTQVPDILCVIFLEFLWHHLEQETKKSERVQIVLLYWERHQNIWRGGDWWSFFNS